MGAKLLSNPNLIEFGHFLGASLAVNLGYSILLRLGNFSGQRIGAWVDHQKVRIIPAMAEERGFDAAKFTADVDALESTHKKKIKTLNIISIGWALFSTFIILILLGLAPFCGCAVSSLGAMAGGLILTGATPAGVIMFFIFEHKALEKMKGYTKEFDGIIKYAKTDADKKIDEMRARMQDELARVRNHAVT